MKRLFFSLVAVVGLASLASAAPIKYTITGKATGNFDGISFVGNDFIFSILGDTNDVADLGGGFLVSTLGMSFTINGVASGTYSNAAAFVSQPGILVGFTDIDIQDLIVFDPAPGADTWDLASAYGPITGGSIADGNFAITTDQGQSLSMVGVSDAVFNATLLPSAAPEPGTLALLGMGAAGLVVARRRKR